jgi:hypothetical protein
MPVFTIQLPDGRHMDAEAASEADALEGAKNWYAQNVTNKTDTSITSALSQGASDLVSGVGKTVKEYIAPDAGKLVQDAGRSVANPKYKPALESFSNPEDGAAKHVLGRDWSKLPRALVEQAPGAATDLIAAVVLKKLGPLAQAAGGVGSYLLRNTGNEAQKRAEGRTGDMNAEPTTEDKTVGLGSTFAQAALNQLALGKLINPAKVAGVGIGGVAQAAGNVAKGAVAEGTTNAAQDAISQIASTIGTKEGVRVDPHSMVDNAIIGGIGGGVFSGGKAAKDSIAAIRFRDVGDDLALHSAAVANRLIDRAGSSEALQSPSDAYHATKDAHADVIRELTTAASALRKTQAVSTDADNALSRAAKGSDLNGSDIAAIDGIDGGDNVKNLAKQATVLARLKNKGNFDPGDERFSGGVAEQVRKLVKRNPLLTGGAYAGGNALTAGTDALASTLGSNALPAIGVYVGTRAAERALGITAPARTFAEKFADRSVPVRSQEPSQPRETRSTSVPQIPPRKPAQPWGAPKPETDTNTIIDDGIANLVQDIRTASLRDRLNAAEASGKDQPEALKQALALHAVKTRTEGSSAEHPYHGLSDNEVRAKATQDAVDAGVIPDIPAARERYGQGVQRKRDAIREAVYNASNSEGYTDADVETFHPFFTRLLTARTRNDAMETVTEAMTKVSPKAGLALSRHLGPEFASRVWKKR